jgi:hypothetical protein
MHASSCTSLTKTWLLLLLLLLQLLLMSLLLLPGVGCP